MSERICSGGEAVHFPCREPSGHRGQPEADHPEGGAPQTPSLNTLTVSASSSDSSTRIVLPIAAVEVLHIYRVPGAGVSHRRRVAGRDSPDA